MAIALATVAFFVSNSVSKYIINDVYLSDENKTKREEQYHKSLQDYIDERGIGFEDIDRVSEWQKKNQYVYLMIYKEKTDDQALFIPDDMIENPPTGGSQPPQNPDSGENPNDTTAPDTDGGADGGTDGGAGAEDGAEDDSSDKNEDEKDETGKGNSDKPLGNIGGITVTVPTKSELKKEAEKLEMLFIELPDNQYVYAKFAEYTEYLYYDIANISSLAFGGLIMLMLFLVYISMLTARIRRLGVAVNRVAIGETERQITAVGRDEIALLAGNVERMRSSIVENYNRKKEALDSNTALITSMSHDIRTPLTVLLGYIDVMRAEVEDNPKMQEYIKAAENTAMRLKKLSDDMFGYFLVFGKNEDEMPMEEYDADTLIGQMISEHILLMKENGYTTSVAIDDEGIGGKTVKTDAPSLLRIFDNVFSNIYKYADKSSPVKIEVSAHPCKIVARFENKIRRDKAEVESNGIGLKTCRKLAEFMGAGFSAEADGDKFTVDISLQMCADN